jgi:hypothetical protein
MKRRVSFGNVGAVGIAVGVCFGILVLQLGFVQAAGPQLPREKQVVKDAYAALERQGGNAPAKHADNTQIVPVVGADEPGPMAVSAAGNGRIVEAAFGPPGAVDATFTNNWSATTSSGSVEVYAGGLISDPKQGLIIVALWDRSGVWVGGGRFLTPRKLGTVRVTGAVGAVLTLRGDDASTFSFDALGRVFR